MTAGAPARPPDVHYCPICGARSERLPSAYEALAERLAEAERLLRRLADAFDWNNLDTAPPALQDTRAFLAAAAGEGGGSDG